MMDGLGRRVGVPVMADEEGNACAAVAKLNVLHGMCDVRYDLSIHETMGLRLGP
jgi:hypothetical protein